MANLPNRNRAKSRSRDHESRHKSSDDQHARSHSLAQLEALFAKKGEPGAPGEPPPSRRNQARVVAMPTEPTDPATIQKNKLHGKIMAAEGRPAVTRAVKAFLGAGFELPRDQDTMLKLLEHEDEMHVRTGLSRLSELLRDEQPQRRAVLESRLKRLADDGEDEETRELAGSVLRMVRKDRMP